MPTYSSLSIHIPANRKQEFCGEPPVPVTNAGLFLNHAILLGEILGIDTVEPLETINQVHNLPEAISHFFIEEDYEVMIPFLNQVLAGIDSAADRDGRPLASPAAAKLLAHPLLRQTEGGSLVLLSHDIYLFDLRESLVMIRDMFVFARDHQLLVRME
jgi:hypothetical protein